jgi:hypothetical protein
MSALDELLEKFDRMAALDDRPLPETSKLLEGARAELEERRAALDEARETIKAAWLVGRFVPAYAWLKKHPEQKP